MQKLLFAVLISSAVTSYAGVAEQAAQIEREGAAYYVKNCRPSIADFLKSQSYYQDRDVDGMLASFSDKKLTDEFMRSAESHATMDSRVDSVLQRRMASFKQILSAPDAAGKCSELGSMFDVYVTMGEAQQNLVSDKKGNDEGNLIAAHTNDPVTVDYTMLVKSVGGTSRQNRPAKGTVRKLTLGSYLEWERTTAANWKGELWNANGMKNKNLVYNNCLSNVTDEWVKSFGYRESTLRAGMFIDGAVGIDKVLRIVCQPG